MSIRTATVLVVVGIAGSTLASSCFAQPYQKGDKAVVTRDGDLKVQTQVVGKVRAGDELTVEQVQGDWLWVRFKQTNGWLADNHVKPADPTVAEVEGGEVRSRTQITKDKPIEVLEVLEATGQGKAVFAPGDAPGSVVLDGRGDMAVYSRNGRRVFSVACVNDIELAPNLEVPLLFFTEQTEEDLARFLPRFPESFLQHVERHHFTGIQQSWHVKMQDGSPTGNHLDALASGPVGARLKKDGKRFHLVDGEAWLLRKGGHPTESPKP